MVFLSPLQSFTLHFHSIFHKSSDTCKSSSSSEKEREKGASGCDNDLDWNGGMGREGWAHTHTHNRTHTYIYTYINLSLSRYGCAMPPCSASCRLGWQRPESGTSPLGAGAVGEGTHSSTGSLWAGPGQPARVVIE